MGGAQVEGAAEGLQPQGHYLASQGLQGLAACGGGVQMLAE